MIFRQLLGIIHRVILDNHVADNPPPGKPHSGAELDRLGGTPADRFGSRRTLTIAGLWRERGHNP